MDWYKLISIIVHAIKTPSQKLPCFSGHFSNLGQENCCNAFQRIAKLCVCDGMSLDPRKCHSKHCRHPRWWEKGGGSRAQESKALQDTPATQARISPAAMILGYQGVSRSTWLYSPIVRAWMHAGGIWSHAGSNRGPYGY